MEKPMENVLNAILRVVVVGPVLIAIVSQK
jgi:hypothetical protein